MQEPHFARVFSGEQVQFSEAKYAFDRYDTGALEDAWFDATFIPVALESGEIGGSLSILFESTHRVRARALEADRESLLRTTETAERAERDSAAQLQVALEAAALGSWSYQLGAPHAWNSARANGLLGREPVQGRITFPEFLACVEEADRIGAAAHAGDGRVGQPVDRVEQLLP